VPKEDDEMWSAIIIGLDGLPITFPMNGLAIVGPSDDPNGPRGGFAIPQAALDRGPCFRMDTQPAFSGQGNRWDEIQRLNTAPPVKTVEVPAELTKDSVMAWLKDHTS
jgi:hypothetical protein